MCSMWNWLGKLTWNSAWNIRWSWKVAASPVVDSKSFYQMTNALLSASVHWIPYMKWKLTILLPTKNWYSTKSRLLMFQTLLHQQSVIQNKLPHGTLILHGSSIPNAGTCEKWKESIPLIIYLYWHYMH